MLNVISERGTKDLGTFRAEYLSHRERTLIEDEPVREVTAESFRINVSRHRRSVGPGKRSETGRLVSDS